MKPCFSAICVWLVVLALVTACVPPPQPTAGPAKPGESAANPTSQPTAEPVAMPAPTGDIIERAAMFKPLDMSQSALLSSQAGWERSVLDKLLQAADLMDAAYWQQADPEGEQIFRSLAETSDATEQAARFLLDANYGRWDRFDNFVPFLGNEPRPAGAYVYPPDLTKQELDAYTAAHPEEKAALLNPFTVVRREGNRLVAVPYHEAYAAFVQPAADLLDQAAALSQNETLTTYLRLEAAALRTDEYYEANMAWLDLDSNLDVSIGPHETYDDQLAGQKAFYKANVLIVDRLAARQLAALMAAVPALQARLPVPPEFRPDQTGTMTPLELADDVYRTGQSRAIMEGVAFSLPNDPKVWEAKGAKKVMMGNYLDARRTEVLTPLAGIILADPVARQLEAQQYFNWVLLHEVAHTLGPRTVQKDGQEITVSQALGEYYSPIEEGKADIVGLYEVPYLLDQGIITGTLESHYVGYLAEALRSIRFGTGSAYGMIRSAAWNYFVEQGALRYDSASARFDLNMERMTAAVEQLAELLLTIEGNGDVAGARAFLDRYMSVAPELRALLDRADQSVPVEFVPIKQRPALPVSPVAPAALTSTPTAVDKATVQSVTTPAATSAAPSVSTATNVAQGATPQPTPVTGASTPVTGGIPLKDALPSLTPQDVWQNFYNITQVPRSSGHLDQIRSFLVNFGKGLNLDTTVDQAGNVLIRKPASRGMENRPGVVLQAHMDMVAQGAPGKDFDPLTDPIQAYVAGDWVHADDTTLGADDGMGMAIITALLQRQDLAAPAIEALFTVDEETSMSGINGLGTGELHGTNYVNLDEHEEGHFVIGSAGGLTAQSSLAYQTAPLGSGTFVAYTVTVTGLTGGHSAMDIDKGRGHAVKLLVRLLRPAGGQFGLRLASLQGGTAKNAIPVEANALVVLYSAQAPSFTTYANDFEKTVRKELAATEPNLAVKWVTATLPSQVMSLAGQEKVLDALYANPQGVLRMSDTVSGLVETSNNLGMVTVQNGSLQATNMSRSAVDSALMDAGAMVTSVWDLASAQSAVTGHTEAWTPNPDSALLGMFMDTYRQLYGVDANYTAIHAGLECGAVAGKYPQMDIIALGETVADAHAPTERVQLSTVPRVVDLLVAVLRQIPVQ